MNRLRLLGLLAALVILASMGFRDVPKAQAGTPVDVTLTITRVEEIHCDEDFPETCPNDYYPKFNIGLKGLFDGKDMFCCAHGTDFRPNWAHTRTVDSDANPVQIHVELWDQDDLSSDNIIDIAPGDPRSLDLTFDLNTCTFQGGGLTKEQGAGIPNLLEGHSGGGPEESARITFTITTRSCIDKAYQTDSDGDGLFNGWETTGIDIGPDGNAAPVLDGTPDLALGAPPFDADPNYKDLFVEADWMDCAAGGCAGLATQHSHKPDKDALGDVEGAFARAPVGNPDNKLGITLHAMPGEAVPDVPDIKFESTLSGTLDDFDDIKLGNPANPCDGSFGTAADRASPNCANILAAKKLVFRYMIFGHSFQESPKSSGDAETGRQPDDSAKGGNDFIVTLGAPFDAPCIAKTGSPCIPAGQRRVFEASTFMHELGHTLGLLHGGADRFINCKPNYLSVMNYTLQFPEFDPNRPMDYSTAELGALNESGLDETKGIGGPAGRMTVYGVGGKWRTRPADAATIDWNEINGLETNATADINFISIKGGCDTASPNETLNGFDDWQHIKYNFRESNDFADGARGPGDPELTGDMVLAMRARADLKVAKSVDKAIAVGGDTLNYSVPVTNLGRGKAISVSLTDTLPDGSTQTRALPDLDPNASNTQAFTYAVPCATPDGTVFTNHASVTGTDEQHIPDLDLRDNTAQASTTVHAPVLTLSERATASVNAGEAINYTITYENTGSGAAANVVVADVLPAGVYYSKALDLGAGPKPDTITLNADGTRTLTWNVGAVPASSGPQTIVFTARPTLLALSGTSYDSNVSLSFQNANGCVYDTFSASSSTTITVVAPTRDPLTLGFWRNHPELWTAEILARIQATDQQYDANGDGALSAAEATAMLESGGNQPKILQTQLLATYFNLATRRINAGTTISSKTAAKLGLANVRDAAIFTMDTLRLPVSPTNVARYDDATRVLDEINNNKSEVY